MENLTDYRKKVISDLKNGNMKEAFQRLPLNELYKILLMQEFTVLRFMKKWMIEFFYFEIAEQFKCEFCRLFHLTLASLYAKSDLENQEENETDENLKKQLSVLKEGFSIDIPENAIKSKIYLIIQLSKNISNHNAPIVTGSSVFENEKFAFTPMEFFELNKLGCLFLSVCFLVHNSIDIEMLLKEDINVVDLAKKHYEEITGIEIEEFPRG